jgi:hypothetical protein
MFTFREFTQSLEEDDRKKALEVVRKGMNLDSDDFWDGFLSLCGNVEGMSALLGAPREIITGLGGKIRELKGEIEEKDSDMSKKDKIIKTGNET